MPATWQTLSKILYYVDTTGRMIGRVTADASGLSKAGCFPPRQDATGLGLYFTPAQAQPAVQVWWLQQGVNLG